MRSTLLLLVALGASAQGVDSPIHTAVQENDVEAIKRHLKGGADQNAIHPGSGQTPLRTSWRKPQEVCRRPRSGRYLRKASTGRKSTP